MIYFFDLLAYKNIVVVAKYYGGAYFSLWREFQNFNNHDLLF